MLFKILGAPFTLPAAGMRFVFQQIADLADAELYDEGVVHEQLLLLQLQLEEGDVDEEAYVEREAELLARLRAIKDRKRELARDQAASEIPVGADVGARRRVIVESALEDTDRTYG